jgi:hypothetical protein
MKKHGRDPEQLSDWLSGRHHPFRKNRDMIERFFVERGIFKALRDGPAGVDDVVRRTSFG